MMFQWQACFCKVGIGWLALLLAGCLAGCSHQQLPEIQVQITPGQVSEVEDVFGNCYV